MSSIKCQKKRGKNCTFLPRSDFLTGILHAISASSVHFQSDAERVNPSSGLSSWIQPVPKGISGSRLYRYDWHGPCRRSSHRIFAAHILYRSDPAFFSFLFFFTSVFGEKSRRLFVQRVHPVILRQQLHLADGNSVELFQPFTLRNPISDKHGI